MIAISGLVKSFGSTRALDGLDLTVRQGEVHGFLGPNGAGKTTTIRVLLGLLRADAGAVRLLDGDPWADAVALHRRLAYVPGDVSLWPKLTGGETIDLFGRLRGDLDATRRDELIERFELDPTKRTRTYSKGNRQKVALIAGLASSAELLILDEPTSGLDPLMEAVFQSCIREVRTEGRTVLLSSHILAEVEALCDSVSIIRAGKTVQSGTLDEMRTLTRTSVVAETTRPALGLRDVDGVHSLKVDGARIEFDVDTRHLDAAMACLLQAGIVSLRSSPPTLEEMFLRHYGDDLARGPATRGVVNDLVGTGSLTHLIARRDRVRIVVWVLAIAGLVYITAASTIGLYPTQADLDKAAEAARDNPAALAFNGPDVALDTLGGQVAFQIGAVGLTLVGLMSLLMVSRLTRGEEDSGRLELVRSMPVGRRAPIAAAVWVVAAMNIAVGALTAVSLIVLDLPTMGSLVLGASFTALGFFFVGVTLVAAQITENPRVASGIAGGVLGLSFVLPRVSVTWATARSRGSRRSASRRSRVPMAATCGGRSCSLSRSLPVSRWWPPGSPLAGTSAPDSSRRGPGPATASPAMGSPIGLAVRLQRGIVWWWGVAVFLAGVAYGSIADSIEDFIADSEALEDIVARVGADSVVDAYLATTMLILALIAAGCGLQAVQRLRSEESDRRPRTRARDRYVAMAVGRQSPRGRVRRHGAGARGRRPRRRAHLRARRRGCRRDRPAARRVRSPTSLPHGY